MGFDRNPLRRRSDRIETVIRAGLIVIFLVCSPLAAIGVGHYVREGAEQGVSAGSRPHQVRAVVLADSTPYQCSRYGCRPAMTSVRWQAPGGPGRTAQIRLGSPAQAGDHVTLWAGRTGALAAPPASLDYTAAAFAAAAFTVLALAVVCLLAGVVAHAELNVRRMVAWQNRWSVVEPMWSGRR